ncbi:MAG: siphovirus Gp157 family protein [Deltaproteobacteria bacterium]|nr:siphovirus Gp157 family protein [Deltaproteobacteria bacterium]
MNDSLYNLSHELAAIHDEIIDSEGVISSELERRLDDCGLAFTQKVEGIARWTKNIEGKEAALDAEIARLQARKKATVNLRERLKGYLLESMTTADKLKVEFPAFTVAVQRNPPSAEITNKDILPSKYLEVVMDVAVDKKALLDDLKAGVKVEGAKLVSNKTHLRVR